MRTLVIVPTYNERDNLPRLIHEVLALDPELDMLVVDDNSPDGTGELADEQSRSNARVQVLHRPGKLGLGSAYLAGFQRALAQGYDRIVEMDADFSHRPEDLPRLLEASRFAGVAVGSRMTAGGRAEGRSPLRRLISRLGSVYAGRLLGLPVTDCTSGYKCFRREALAALDLDQVRSNGYAFQVELNYLCHQAGFRLAEVPIVFPDRVAGKSKMSWRILFEAAALVWQIRQRPVPLRATTSPVNGRAPAIVRRADGGRSIVMMGSGERR